MSYKPTIFAVDTSTVYLYLAGSEPEKDGAQTLLVKPDKNESDWFSIAFKKFALERLNAHADSKSITGPQKFWNIKEALNVSAIAIGAGPGSFTGLRISFAYIRTVALLWKVPLITYDSGKLWHSSICEPDEILLTQLNKNLYSGYGEQMNLGAKNVDEWHQYFKERPGQKAAVWNGATYALKSGNTMEEEKKRWPENCRMVGEPARKPVFPVETDPDNVKNMTLNWAEALPNYGHEIQVTNKKQEERNTTI